MIARSRIVVLASLLTAFTASAAERIAILAPGLDVQSQLEEVLCVSQTCVAPPKVSSSGHLDKAKAQRENVRYIVSAKKSAGNMELAVTDVSGQVRYRSVEKAAGEKLAVGALVTVAAKMLDTLENPKSKPDVAPKALAKAAHASKYKRYAARAGSRRG